MASQEVLYRVMCGYEIDPCDLMEGVQVPQVIADGLKFHAAAHLVRTLLEQGEADMVYYMMPACLYWHMTEHSNSHPNFDQACTCRGFEEDMALLRKQETNYQRDQMGPIGRVLAGERA